METRIMKFEDVVNNPSKFVAMTGYFPDEFYALIPWFEQSLAESRYTLEGKGRQNRLTSYKNSPLQTINDKLLFILVYFKQYPTQVVLGEIFGISQSKANLWIHFLTPVLQSALSKSGQAPARNMEDLVLQDAAVFMHDGTERPIQRPSDNAEQKKYYSGKKKMHTVKNDILANADCKVLFLTLTVEGKKHDKKLADESGYRLPKGSKLLQDTGFQGFSVGNFSIIQSKKKPKGSELTESEKETNRAVSKMRIRIEHVISGVKRYRIVKDKCRNWLRGFKDSIMEIACGLHNFRLIFRPWKAIECSLE